MIQRIFNVDVAFDESSGRYVVSHSDLVGLHAESSSAAEIVAMIMADAQMILGVETIEVRTNLPDTDRHVDLTFGSVSV